MNGITSPQEPLPNDNFETRLQSSCRLFQRHTEPLFSTSRDFLSHQRQLRLCQTKEELTQLPTQELIPTGRLFESPSIQKTLPLIISRSSPSKQIPKSPSKISETSIDIPSPVVLPTVKTNLVYSLKRQVLVDPTNKFVSQDLLDDFYSTRPRNMSKLGRECELEVEPPPVYPDDYDDLSQCNQAEIRIHKEIKTKARKLKEEVKKRNQTPPINMRHIRPASIFFNSRFESGNLFEVERVSETEYNLHLSPDFNTPIYTQWYYFSVMNVSKGTKVKFNIMNFYKDDSSYSNGMKPFVYSVKKNKENNSNTWQRGCEDITYTKNSLRAKHRETAPDYEYDDLNIHYYIYEDEESQSINLNTLSFSYTFEYDYDFVFFSHFQPYTHSDLKDYLFHVSRSLPQEFQDSQMKVETLCKTIEDEICYIVTITDQVNDVQANQSKQVVFLTSRVHPGESNASFMMQGAMEFLLSPHSREAQILRETFIFKIVPMLNPDGVIHGNYRCNLVGVDLNRRWPNPSKLLHPTIHYTKKLLKELQQSHSISLYCDFHGHSRKRNIFMYGCLSIASDVNCHKNNNQIKMFPYMLSQRNKTFSFADCKFANEREKEATARLVVYKEIGVLNSYTLESTFYSTFNPKFQKKKTHVDPDHQIKIQDLLLAGEDFCLAMVNILNSKILKKKFVSENSFKLEEKPVEVKLAQKENSKDDRLVTSQLNQSQTPLKVIQANKKKNSSRSQGPRHTIAGNAENVGSSVQQLIKSVGGGTASQTTQDSTEYGTTNTKMQHAIQQQNMTQTIVRVPQQHLMFKNTQNQPFAGSPPKRIKKVINPQFINKDSEKAMANRLTLAQAIAPPSVNESLNESFFPFVPAKKDSAKRQQKQTKNQEILSSLQKSQLQLDNSQVAASQTSINKLELKSSNACSSPAPKMSNPIIAKAIQAQNAGEKYVKASTIQATSQGNLFVSQGNSQRQKQYHSSKRRKLSKKMEQVVMQSNNSANPAVNMNDLSNQTSQNRVSVTACQLSSDKIVYQNKLNLPNLIQILKNNQKSQESQRKLTTQFIISGDVEYYMSRNSRVANQGGSMNKIQNGVSSQVAQYQNCGL